MTIKEYYIRKLDSTEKPEWFEGDIPDEIYKTHRVIKQRLDCPVFEEKLK